MSIAISQTTTKCQTSPMLPAQNTIGHNLNNCVVGYRTSGAFRSPGVRYPFTRVVCNDESAEYHCNRPIYALRMSTENSSKQLGDGVGVTDDWHLPAI